MFIRHNTNTGSLGVYSTKQEAGSDMPVFASAAEFAQTKASLTELARFYNQLTGSNIKKFSDRESAVKRVWDAAIAAQENYDAQQPGPDAQKADAPEAQGEQTEQEQGNSQPDDASQPVVAPVIDNDAATKRRGRKPGTGQFAGKTVFAKKGVNPRRVGTKGWHSYNILIGKMTEGVPYADYIAAGGRAVDLDWDIKHKFAEVK